MGKVLVVGVMALAGLGLGGCAAKPVAAEQLAQSEGQ